MPIASVGSSAAPIELYYEEFGDADAPALLLICGLGAQLLNYPEEWCLAFADRGLRVIRFDNRDVGLSTHLDDGATYSLSDLAADVVGLLDALGIEAAHIWGSSLGGMIAQTVAIEFPERVRTLISVQSTTGEPDVGAPDPAALGALLEVIGPTDDRDEAIRRSVRMFEVLINNPAITDAAQLRARAEANYDRSYDPAGSGRQLGAVMAAPSRADGLAALDLPTLVIHGTNDPLIGISGGRRTAELVPGATFVEVDGMGHDLTPVFWSVFTDAVVRHVAAVEAAN